MGLAGRRGWPLFGLRNIKEKQWSIKQESKGTVENNALVAIWRDCYSLRAAYDLWGIPRGGAVGWNHICLIIPCHRVVGAKGAVTGYGGGMMNKIALLRLEGHRVTEKGISSGVTD